MFFFLFTSSMKWKANNIKMNLFRIFLIFGHMSEYIFLNATKLLSRSKTQMQYSVWGIIKIFLYIHDQTWINSGFCQLFGNFMFTLSLIPDYLSNRRWSAVFSKEIIRSRKTASGHMTCPWIHASFSWKTWELRLLSWMKDHEGLRGWMDVKADECEGGWR